MSGLAAESGVLVRSATRADIPALAALERECFSEPWSESGLAEFMESEHNLLLAAESDGRVVGYIGAQLSFGDADITNVAVTGEFRRRGIGSALIGALASDSRVERMLLEVRESNLGARAMYARLGFKEDGRRRGFYRDPREDAILMSRERALG